MLLLFFVSVAALAILFFGGYFTLFSMLIAGVVIACIWAMGAYVTTRRRV